jgi:AhpD family alkylhydroperoxidase
MTVESIVKQHELTRTEDLASERPRLEPIENPKGLQLRFVYWMTRRSFGKVPTSIKVGVARSPKVLGLASAMGKYEKGIHLGKELPYMINMLVAGANGCGFCLDIGRTMAVKANMNMEKKFNALPTYRTSSLFSGKERAALAYAEEATLNKRVSDATFNELQRHYSDRDIVEITMVTALQNFTNLTNIPLGIGSDGLCAIAQSRRK